ncbi:MAG: hypothetical protein HS116_24155 [Planctomycetes bacterium]|nr:hypothetical protein [Planctomycetota bacterium]
MRIPYVSILLCLCASGAFAQNAFGPAVAPGAVLAPAQGEAPTLPYEPWVDSAKAGDFIVMKYSNGLVQRRAIKEVTAEAVVIETSSTHRGV